MPTITLQYDDPTTGPSQAFTALSVKGFTQADHHVVFPNLTVETLDGTLRAKKAGFRRVFTLDLGMRTDATELSFLGYFLNSEIQYVTFTHDSITETDVRVVARGDTEFQTEWEDGVEIARRVFLVLEEANIRTTYPSGTTPSPTEGASMYFFKRIAVTGTPVSPQTMTFGSGDLVTDAANVAAPTVNDTTTAYRVEIDGSPYQEAKVYLASTPSINGSDYVTFTIAHSEAGQAASDGAYYTDITLWVKTKV